MYAHDDHVLDAALAEEAVGLRGVGNGVARLDLYGVVLLGVNPNRLVAGRIATAFGVVDRQRRARHWISLRRDLV